MTRPHGRYAADRLPQRDLRGRYASATPAAVGEKDITLGATLAGTIGAGSVMTFLVASATWIHAALPD